MVKTFIFWKFLRQILLVSFFHHSSAFLTVIHIFAHTNMQEELDQMNAFKVSFDDSILIFRSSGIILWQIKHMPVIKENQYIA